LTFCEGKGTTSTTYSAKNPIMALAQLRGSRLYSIILIAIVLAITVPLAYAIGRPMALGFAATMLLGLASLSSEATNEPEPILLGAAVIATLVMLGGMVFV
jgi:hypothetical protein